MGRSFEVRRKSEYLPVTIQLICVLAVWNIIAGYICPETADFLKRLVFLKIFMPDKPLFLSQEQRLFYLVWRCSSFFNVFLKRKGGSV